MELNFDKEIDSLLRQTAKGKSAFVDEIPNSNHLDADEISAGNRNFVVFYAVFAQGFHHIARQVNRESQIVKRVDIALRARRH